MSSDINSQNMCNAASIDEAHKRSTDMLSTLKDDSISCTMETAEIIKDAKASTSSSSGDSRKSSMRNKIGSATELSKDVNFVSSEVTGCIPILPTSSVSVLDSQFTMQNHGTTRKVRRVSSGTDK